MSKQINGSALKLSRASKIQVEVKEIANHATAKNISWALYSDEPDDEPEPEPDSEPDES